MPEFKINVVEYMHQIKCFWNIAYCAHLRIFQVCQHRSEICVCLKIGWMMQFVHCSWSSCYFATVPIFPIKKRLVQLDCSMLSAKIAWHLNVSVRSGISFNLNGNAIEIWTVITLPSNLFNTNDFAINVFIVMIFRIKY